MQPAARSWTAAAIGGSGSNAPVFTLPAWAHTIRGPRTVSTAAASSSARIGPGRRRPPGRRAPDPEAQHLQRGVDRDVRLGADDHRDLRELEQAAVLDHPSHLGEDAMAGGREQ